MLSDYTLMNLSKEKMKSSQTRAARAHIVKQTKAVHPSISCELCEMPAKALLWAAEQLKTHIQKASGGFSSDMQDENRLAGLDSNLSSELLF